MIRKLFVLASPWFLFFFASHAAAAEKIRVAFVSPSATQSPVWIAKEAGFFAKQGLDAEVLLLTGSPRMVQTLISGDIDYAIVGATAAMRARMRGADVVMLATAANLSNMKLLVGRDSGIRRLEDLKGKALGVSQYGSDADGFARMVVEKAGLKPDKDVPIIQLGGHPQVAAAIAAGKIPAGVLGGLALNGAEIRRDSSYQRSQTQSRGAQRKPRDYQWPHPAQPRLRDAIHARLCRRGTLLQDQSRRNSADFAEVHGRHQQRTGPRGV